jgi:preprotein translocase subunit YajC
MRKFAAIIASFLVSGSAFAAGAAPAGGFNGESIGLLVLFVIVFYFLLLRPQMKRSKEHRKLLGSLEKGAEVVTTGGIAGTVSKVEDSFISVSIAKDVTVKVQKDAVTNVLPKGTL